MVPEIWSVTESLSFWTISLPFYPPNNSENQIFEKMKKKKKKKNPRDTIILHMYTINDNHVMYGS